MQIPILIATLAFSYALSFAKPLSVTTHSKAAPASPYIDRGVCPFECCTYRSWQASESVVVFDRPHGKITAHIAKGDWVRALTGQVRSLPRRIEAPFDSSENGIQKGDVIFVLHPQGEGGWVLWVKGKHVLENFDLPKADEPKTEWWAKVRLSNGHVGWVRAEDNFHNQDACGS